MKLHEYISLHRRTPFAWGAMDCALFAAGWIKQATGVDFLSEYPAWTSEEEADEVIEIAGGLHAVMDSRFRRVNPAQAMDGDIALRAGGLCIFSGTHIVTTGETRLYFTSREEAECAWSLR